MADIFDQLNPQQPAAQSTQPQQNAPTAAPAAPTGDIFDQLSNGTYKEPETQAPSAGFLSTLGSDIYNMGASTVKMAVTPWEHLYNAADSAKKGNYSDAAASIINGIRSINDPTAEMVDSQWQSSAQAKDRMIEAAKKGDALGAAQHAVGVLPMASQVDDAMTNYQKNPTRENLAHIVSTALPVLLPAAGRGLGAVHDYVKPTITENLAPVTEAVAGNEIPVPNPSTAAKIVRSTTSPELSEKFTAEQTEPAVRQAIPDIAKQAAGTEGEPAATPTDRSGVSSIGDEKLESAKDVFQTADAITDNAFTKAQDATKLALKQGDYAAYREGLAKQESILEQTKDAPEMQGKDSVAARVNWRQGNAFNAIGDELNKQISLDSTNNYFLQSADGYLKAINRLELNGIFKDADMTNVHVQNLRRLGELLKQSENAPRFNSLVKATTKLASAGIGLITGAEYGQSMLGLGGGSVAGSYASSITEPIINWVADRTVGNILTDANALKTLNAGIATGARPDLVAQSIVKELKTGGALQKLQQLLLSKAERVYGIDSPLDRFRPNFAEDTRINKPVNPTSPGGAASSVGPGEYDPAVATKLKSAVETSDEYGTSKAAKAYAQYIEQHASELEPEDLANERRWLSNPTKLGIGPSRVPSGYPIDNSAFPSKKAYSEYAVEGAQTYPPKTVEPLPSTFDPAEARRLAAAGDMKPYNDYLESHSPSKNAFDPEKAMQLYDSGDKQAYNDYRVSHNKSTFDPEKATQLRSSAIPHAYDDYLKLHSDTSDWLAFKNATVTGDVTSSANLKKVGDIRKAWGESAHEYMVKHPSEFPEKPASVAEESAQKKADSSIEGRWERTKQWKDEIKEALYPNTKVRRGGIGRDTRTVPYEGYPSADAIDAQYPKVKSAPATDRQGNPIPPGTHDMPWAMGQSSAEAEDAALLQRQAEHLLRVSPEDSKMRSIGGDVKPEDLLQHTYTPNDIADPKGRFYKTVIGKLHQEGVYGADAEDLAQDVMADFIKKNRFGIDNPFASNDGAIKGDLKTRARRAAFDFKMTPDNGVVELDKGGNQLYWDTDAKEKTTASMRLDSDTGEMVKNRLVKRPAKTVDVANQLSDKEKYGGARGDIDFSETGAENYRPETGEVKEKNYVSPTDPYLEKQAASKYSPSKTNAENMSDNLLRKYLVEHPEDEQLIKDAKELSPGNKWKIDPRTKDRFFGLSESKMTELAKRNGITLAEAESRIKNVGLGMRYERVWGGEFRNQHWTAGDTAANNYISPGNPGEYESPRYNFWPDMDESVLPRSNGPQTHVWDKTKSTPFYDAETGTFRHQTPSPHAEETPRNAGQLYDMHRSATNAQGQLGRAELLNDRIMQDRVGSREIEEGARKGEVVYGPEDKNTGRLHAPTVGQTLRSQVWDQAIRDTSNGVERTIPSDADIFRNSSAKVKTALDKARQDYQDATVGKSAFEEPGSLRTRPRDVARRAFESIKYITEHRSELIYKEVERQTHVRDAYVRAKDLYQMLREQYPHGAQGIDKFDLPSSQWVKEHLPGKQYPNIHPKE